jgi:hypothetical protein
MLSRQISTNKHKKNGGYVALISVLVTSAIGVIIALSLLTNGLNSLRSVSSVEQEYGARALAKACANVALEKIRLDTTYLGDEGIDFEDNHCDIFSIDKSQNTYNISIEGIVGSILRKTKVAVRRSEDPDTHFVLLVVQSWQEVDDF